MVSAKRILLVKPITAQATNALVKRVHYSGKIVNNSTLLHLRRVILMTRIRGRYVIFNEPSVKRKVLPLVEGYVPSWNGMLELNRWLLHDW